ncbi:MAG: hypothetical protein R3B09_08295 [Nannocystaceae bacterium]
MLTRPLNASHGLRALALGLCVFVPTATLPTPAAAQSGVLAMAKSKKKKSKPKAAEPEEDKLTVEESTEARKAVQERAQPMLEAQPAAAAELLADEARKLGDPILFLDAADAYKKAGEKDREVAPVEAAMEEARIGLDILYFLQDPRASENWKIIPDFENSIQITRGRDLLGECEALIEEINKEKAPPEVADGGGGREKAPRDGRGLIAGGSLLTAIGVGGLGMMGAGMAMGASAQKTVEDPTVVGDEFDEADAKGKRANVITYAGIGVAAVGLISGVTLLVLGVKKRKAYRAGAGSETALRVDPILSPTLTGFSLSGRF